MTTSTRRKYNNIMAYKIPKIKLGAPIMVDWFDAHHDETAFGSSKELVEVTCNLVDIGFFVGSNKKYITIAVEKDRDDPDDFRHTHHIPKVNITQVTLLEVPDAAGANVSVSNSRRERVKQGQNPVEHIALREDN